MCFDVNVSVLIIKTKMILFAVLNCGLLFRYVDTAPAVVTNYTAFPNQYIKGMNLEVYNNLTEEECAQKCTNYWASYNQYQCVSFDYDTAMHKCFLSDRTLETIWEDTMLVSANGTHHYQRGNVDVCEIDSADRKECAKDKEECLKRGCCWRTWKCYLSKSSLPTNPLPCDASCSSVIEDMVNNAENNAYNHTQFLEASLAEAKAFLPDIPQTFWNWLCTVKQGYMMEAMFAVKWPVSPRLIRNLFAIVTEFGTETAANNIDLFVGVAYAMISTSVKIRANVDNYRLKEMFLPKEAAATEGLSQSEIDSINAEAETDALSYRQITQEQMDQKFNKYSDSCNGFCCDDPTWVMLYKYRDHRRISTSCVKVGGTVYGVNSLDECKKVACARRGNAFNYLSAYKKCYIHYCANGKITIGSGYADTYILREEEPVCTMEAQTDNGKQKSGKRGRFKVKNATECEQECMDRAMCVSFTFTGSKSCYIWDTLDDLSSVDNDYYVYKRKICTQNNPVTCTANEGAAHTCIASADDPNVALISERLTKIHSASENKTAGCYKELKSLQQVNLTSCQGHGIAMRANLVLYRNGECILKRCFTSNLSLTDISDGYDIYQDHTLLFDQGTPLTWEVQRNNYILDDYMDYLSSNQMETCKVSSEDDIPFPPHLRMNGFDLIQHYLSRKYEFWRFPTLSSPWPLMSLLWPDGSKRECDFVWSVVYSNVEPVLYSKYTKDYEDRVCWKSDWHKTSIPRIIQDGGVCGRLSWLAETSYVCLGQPAIGASEPGHRALIYLVYDKEANNSDPLYGQYRFKKSQSIANSVFYTNPKHWFWLRQVPTGKEKVEKSYMNMEFYMGLAASINKGLKSYTKGLIAIALHNRSPPALKDKSLVLLVNALKENPYQVNVWLYLNNYFSGVEYTNYKTNYKMFAVQCPTSEKYNATKDELLGLAKQHLRRQVSNDMKVGFPVTYTDVMVRFYAPAPCCVGIEARTKIISTLKEEVVELQKYTKDDNTFIDAVRHFQLNMALCNAYAQNSTWLEILDFVGPSIIDISSRIEYLAKHRMSDTMNFLDVIMEVKGGMTTNNMQVVVDYLKDNITNNVAKITVTSSTWIVSSEYDKIAKKMINLYQALDQDSNVDEIKEELSDLVDRQHGTDLDWWQDMKEEGFLKGEYEDVLDGIVVWDSDKNQFVSSAP